MALLVKTLKNRGVDVKVVYDCVWWKNSQASKEEIEDYLISCTRTVMKKFYECSKTSNSVITAAIDESTFFDKFGYIIFNDESTWNVRTYL